MELHVNLVEGSVKGEVALPHGTGREVQVVVFNDQTEEELQKGTINFDLLIAKPADMKRIVRFAKLLGPKGRMPGPKKGTVTEAVDEAIKKIKSGGLHYKSEPKFPLFHQVVGTTKFSEKQLQENISILLRAIGQKQIKKIYITTSMSPSIEVDASALFA